MATYKYSYTIDQFLNDQYDLSKLDTEIRDSSITVAFGHYTRSFTSRSSSSAR